MKFCSKCGAQNEADDAFCSACGTSALTPTSAQMQPTESAVTNIDSLDVSDLWKTRFHEIKKAGGPNLPLYKSMMKEDKKKVSKAVSGLFGTFLLAFFFSFFYYLAKGMWKKGLTLLAILMVIGLFVNIFFEMFGIDSTNLVGVVCSVVFAQMACRDFYDVKVLGYKGWSPVKFWWGR